MHIIIVSTIMTVFIAGCTSTRGKAYTAPDWSQPPALGKVMVMPVRYADADEGDVARKKAVELQCAAREALAELPNVQFVEAPPGDLLPSDFEAVMAARQAGADTVCLLTVGDYGESFWITLFLPAFGGNSRVQYSLRLLDVRSGTLLLEAIRARSRGGHFVIPAEGSARRELKKDLSLVLAGQVGTAPAGGH